LGKKVLLHNKGTPRRTWLHASDTAEAVITIMEKGIVNEIYNISGTFEEQNIVVAKKIINLLGLTGNEETYLDTNYERPGQDVRYAIDDTKIKSLGWEPKANFDNELVKIVKYYKENFIW
jgi:dTDP-D-glucose 4,6-dehydratase